MSLVSKIKGSGSGSGSGSGGGEHKSFEIK